MIKNLETIMLKFEEIERKLADPDTMSAHKEMQKYFKERSELLPLIEKIRQYKKLIADADEAENLMRTSSDNDFKTLAKEEFDLLKELRPVLEEELKLMLIPRDPRDEKNVILEIRAGTGGDEAALFVSSLFKMYSRYAEGRKWRVETIDASDTELGGYKEIVANITGSGAYSRLKYESGVHRVQRVPATEASGRVHTSTVTVAVLPEAEEVDLKIEEKDLRLDTFCSHGPGGQGVNTTYSAVRIVHLPTGITVQCQDERSQIKNRAKAMKVLRSRLYELELEKIEKERADHRKSQIGTGDRSERIRTYNFPQTRVTDHRIGLTLHKLTQVLEGSIDEIIDALNTHYQAETLKNLGG
jgi:peptide chain release factor 1